MIVLNYKDNPNDPEDNSYFTGDTDNTTGSYIWSGRKEDAKSFDLFYDDEELMALLDELTSTGFLPLQLERA